MGNHKSKPKWLKASLALEAAVGDDSEAYLVDESELADLLEDDETEATNDLDPIDDDMPGDDDANTDEDADPLMVWDEDEERFV
jgi:hypothetical protein